MKFMLSYALLERTWRILPEVNRLINPMKIALLLHMNMELMVLDMDLLILKE